MSIFSYCLRALADLFFTRNCLVCGRGLEPGQKYVCDACLDDMPLTYFWQRSENPAMHRLGVRPGEGGACREGCACVEDVPRDACKGASVPVASGTGVFPGDIVPRDACGCASVPVASGTGVFPGDIVPRDTRGGAAVPVTSVDGVFPRNIVPRDAREGAAVPVASGDGAVSGGVAPRDACKGASVPVASGTGVFPGNIVPRDACGCASVPVASGVNAGCRVHDAAALFFYRHESPWCEVVRRFKYGRDEGLGLWASRLLGSYLSSGGLYADIQAVVPVPLHWYKRFRRGFNQAEIIARGVAEGLAGSHAGGLAGSHPEGLAGSHSGGHARGLAGSHAGGFAGSHAGGHAGGLAGIHSGACCQAGAGGLALDEALSGMSPLEGSKSGSRADAAPSHQHPGNTHPRDVGGNGKNVTTMGSPASTYTPAGTHTAASSGSGGCIAMPVAAHLLRRRRYTGTQTRKTAAERRGNIAGAFALNPRALARLKAAGVRHVLLVDDVLTTGATLSECIRLLSPHFRVSVATLGFVE